MNTYSNVDFTQLFLMPLYILGFLFLLATGLWPLLFLFILFIPDSK